MTERVPIEDMPEGEREEVVLEAGSVGRPAGAPGYPGGMALPEEPVGPLDQQQIPTLEHGVRTARHVLQHREQQAPPRQLLSLPQGIEEPVACGVPALAGVSEHTDGTILALHARGHG